MHIIIEVIMYIRIIIKCIKPKGIYPSVSGISLKVWSSLSKDSN